MSYPPTPQRKSCDCSDPCISTDDVYYAGPNLPNSGINTYNVLTEVIEKLDAIYAVPTLQKVTEANNFTNLPIIADSFVKIGGTGDNILLDNGDVLSIGDLPVGVTETSQLINDGENGVDPFITALDIPTYTSSFINDGQDGLNPYITAEDVIVQIIQVDTFSLLPEIGEYNVVYITLDTYKFYIWEGYYVEVGSSVTNLEYVQGITNGYINNSNGTSAELLLADETYAGLFSPEEKIKLETIEPYANVGVIPNTPITGNTNTIITFDDKGLVTSGDNATTDDIIEAADRRYITDAQQIVLNNTSGINTGDETTSTIKSKLGITTLSGSNTGDQNLQTVTDGVGNASTTNPITITVGAGGANGITSFSSQGFGIRGESNETIAVYATSNSTGVYAEGNVGVHAYSAGGTGIEVYGNGNIGISVNLGNSNKGLLINSGASSTGNPIEIVKSDNIKFTINQQGEQSIVKIPGGTGTNVLLDNGTTAAVSSLGSQNLQEVTNEGANTTNAITVNSAVSAITGNSTEQVGVYGTSVSGTGIAGTSIDDVGVYGSSTNAVGGVFNTVNGATIIEFQTNSVLKASINNAGELTAQKLIKDGGSSSEILMADGSIITAGTNITINGGQISSTGGGGGGGGSSVSYYLNGGTAASVAGYYQFSQSAVIGTGVDFPLTGNGLISQWLTDVGDPNKLEILGGNWNLETYMSVSSTGGSPGFYVELLKYDGTTFTTIANNSATPELITATTIDLYFSSLAIPQTTLLATDRLALRYYIVGVTGGRTVTMHTQDSHLCQVITNFANGIIYLNGLNASSQSFGIATTGTDFNILSSGSTHTFYLPSASSIHRGALTSADWTIFNNKQNALSGTGFVKIVGTTISYDNSTYLTANQSITLSGAITGTGATTIVTTLGTGVVGLTNLSASGTKNNTTYLRGDNTWATVSSGGTITLSAIGSAPNANGATITGSVLNLQPANASNGGVITTGIQTIAGAKTFSSNPSSSATMPPISDNSTLLATTAYVDRQVGTGIPIYNIKITTLAGTSSINTQEPGISDGIAYSQNGRNVMINNTDPISIISSGAPDQFIASYTKLTPIGIQDISFSTSGVTMIYPNGLILSGSAGSTALLTKNGSTVYLLINNLP